MEQLVLLLVIAAISFINWIIQKSAEHRQKRKLEREALDGDPHVEPELQETPARDWKAPEEELRKFLEAMGMPVEAEPPPPIPRTPPPTPPPVPVPVTPSKPHTRRTTTTREMRELASSFEHANASAASTTELSLAGTYALLSSQEKIREAIVLREILGPPRALLPYGNEPG